MNIAKIISFNQEEEPRAYDLEEKKGELAQIVEAINAVEASEGWQKLKRLLFDDAVARLERELLDLASRPEISTPDLYRVQGQLLWARKYSDLKKLSDRYRDQIEGINHLQHEQNPNDGAF